MNKTRWDEVLSTSARLFRQKGYRATSMDNIAAELNMTKPALYYYIKSKHDLLFAICRSGIEMLLEGVREIDAVEQPPEDKLRALIGWHVNMFSKYSDIFNVYLADEGELSPETRDYIVSLSREYENTYRRVLESAVSRGEFRSLDVPMTVRAITGMCNWLSAWYRQDGQQSADRIAATFSDLILNGCRKAVCE